MCAFKKWVVLVALLYLPGVYFVAAFALSTKISSAASALALAPYAVGLLMIAYLIKGKCRWLSGRGAVAIPFAILGYAALAVIFAATAVMGF